MGKYEDARENLDWLREELLAAEEDCGGEYEEDYEEETEDWEDYDEDQHHHRAPRNRAVDFGRMVYEDEGFDEDSGVFIDPPRKKGILGYLILAVLEILAILAIVRWWLQWL